jgi:hypothetical protein
MKPDQIAQIAHDVNRAYCASLGDDSVPAWAEAPESHHASLIAGVNMHLANPDATPEQAHESWLQAKLADGWTYGDVKDAEKKVHPCIKAYAELPAEQKAKDYLFRGVVHAVKGLVLAVDVLAPDLAKLQPREPRVPTAGMVPVKYIGRRDSFVDRIYGSLLKFEKDQVRSVPADLARNFLRHQDQFERGPEQPADATDGPAADDTGGQLEALAKKKAEEDAKENELQGLRDQVARMGKAALKSFALTHYRQKVDEAKTVGELRQDVTQMINAFGA